MTSYYIINVTLHVVVEAFGWLEILGHEHLPHKDHTKYNSKIMMC